MHMSRIRQAPVGEEASPVQLSTAFHSPGITKIVSHAQNGNAPETHSPALMAGLFRTNGLSAGLGGRPHSILCSEMILFLHGSRRALSIRTADALSAATAGCENVERPYRCLLATCAGSERKRHLYGLYQTVVRNLREAIDQQAAICKTL